MYCKHCGKEIADDSKFCSSCGASQELSSVLEEQKINDQSIKASNGIYIVRRLIGSIIDKAIILFISLVIILIITSFDYSFSGELGLFSAFFHMTKDSVYSAAIGHVMSFYPDDYMSQHQLEIDNRFQYLIWVELKIAYMFIMINILYYAICEKMISSSLGKSFMNLRLISVPNSNIGKLSLAKVLFRALCFFIIMSGIIGLRWIMGFNYFIAITLFFLIMDLPVLFKRASLLDILTQTKLIFYNKNKSKLEEKTHMDFAERHVVEHPYNVNGKGYIYNIVTFLILIFLIFLNVNYSYLYASFRHYNESLSYKPLYNSTERFAGHGYYLSVYDEPSDIKEIVGPDNLLGNYISTLGFRDGQRNEYGNILYYFQCTISTYDISDFMTIFGNNENKYEKCYSLLAQRTQAKEGKITDDIKVLTWYGKGNVTAKYMGVCANDRLYIIKAESGENLEYRSKWLFDLFDFTYYPKVKYYQSSLIIVTVLIVICCVLFFAVNSYRLRAMPIINRYAYSLFLASLLSIAINIVIASVISYILEKILFEDWSMIILIGAEATAILSSLCLSVFYLGNQK